MYHSYWLLISTALLLGMRHGVDLDHLATIDAITRNTANQLCWSKFSGILFSFGHGLIVVLVSLLVGSGMMQAYVPAELDSFGQAVSIFFLYLFSFITIISLLRSSKGAVISYGFKSFITRKFNLNIKSPFMVIIIGAFFAISFDTVSQVTLFSLSASVVSGGFFSFILGVVFMLGMMITDGINGFVVSGILNRANAVSFVLSRIAGWLIAVFTLLVATSNLIQGMQASA